MNILPLLLALPAPLQLSSVPPQDLEALGRRMTPIVQVVQAARPAVVFIETDVPVARRDIFGRFLGSQIQHNTGSGVVIYEEGYIVTNYHVVRNANELRVRFDPVHDEATYVARLISWNEREDLALLKISGDQPFPTVPMGTSSDLMIGEDVIAIGNPYGQTLSVSRGIISGLHRDIQAANLTFSGLIQTDASINPGNSGGPLVNINGELIGINTVMNTAAENIGFAIPVDQVKAVLRDHLLEPTQARGWLGFEVDVGTLRIDDVTHGGPADAQGLRVGDRLVALGGKVLETGEDYKLARLSVLPDDQVTVRVQRDSLYRSFELRAWDRADYLSYQRAGMTLETIVLSTTRMLRVTNVLPGGPADQLGLRPDDFIEAVQVGSRRPQRVTSPDEFALLLTRLAPDTELRLDVWRDENHNGRLELTSNRSEAYKGTIRLR